MTIEALKQALEALELHAKQYPHMQKGYTVDAITSLRQAIAEAEKQEPYGWVSQHTTKGMYEWQFNKELSGVYKDTAISILPIYTHPQPKREPLTHEQRLDLHTAFEPYKSKWNAQSILIDMVEAAHGIKE